MSDRDTVCVRLVLALIVIDSVSERESEGVAEAVAVGNVRVVVTLSVALREVERVSESECVVVRLSLKLRVNDRVSDSDSVSVRLLLILRVPDAVSDIDSVCVTEAVDVGNVSVSDKLSLQVSEADRVADNESVEDRLSVRLTVADNVSDRDCVCVKVALRVGVAVLVLDSDRVSVAVSEAVGSVRVSVKLSLRLSETEGVPDNESVRLID